MYDYSRNATRKRSEFNLQIQTKTEYKIAKNLICFANLFVVAKSFKNYKNN